MTHVYRLRKHRVGSENQYDAYTIGVPNEIAKVIPDDVRFMPELTSEGILYRAISPKDKSDELPEWASRS